MPQWGTATWWVPTHFPTVQEAEWPTQEAANLAHTNWSPLQKPRYVVWLKMVGTIRGEFVVEFIVKLTSKDVRKLSGTGLQGKVQYVLGLIQVRLVTVN